MSFPCGSDGKESACNAGDPGLVPGSGRSPGEGIATHSSILAWTEEPGGLQCMGLKESDTTERLTLLLTATVAVLGEALLGIVWSSLHGLSYFTTTCGEWLLLLHSFYRLQKAKKGKERLGTCAEVHKVGKVMD